MGLLGGNRSRPPGLAHRSGEANRRYGSRDAVQPQSNNVRGCCSTHSCRRAWVRGCGVPRKRLRILPAHQVCWPFHLVRPSSATAIVLLYGLITLWHFGSACVRFACCKLNACAYGPSCRLILLEGIVVTVSRQALTKAFVGLGTCE